ncbi:hypothetical protein H072_6596 [Dactylellina haptotyla CBS 200.50]|uniref:Ig-like domain-containing protein n=1 Tax=Dactylellina haptotyla (strain CBS 200.50) TaxID=1284197 RepID=S8BWF3_DACHA|nr:hypothetical protein H072_6596 [Dactylellina haptotyla CBS 200.50]
MKFSALLVVAVVCASLGTCFRSPEGSSCPRAETVTKTSTTTVSKTKTFVSVLTVKVYEKTVTIPGKRITVTASDCSAVSKGGQVTITVTTTSGGGTTTWYTTQYPSDTVTGGINYSTGTATVLEVIPTGDDNSVATDTLSATQWTYTTTTTTITDGGNIASYKIACPTTTGPGTRTCVVSYIIRTFSSGDPVPSDATKWTYTTITTTITDGGNNAIYKTACPTATGPGTRTCVVRYIIRTFASGDPIPSDATKWVYTTTTTNITDGGNNASYQTACPATTGAGTRTCTVSYIIRTGIKGQKTVTQTTPGPTAGTTTIFPLNDAGEPITSAGTASVIITTATEDEDGYYRFRRRH